jgi:putative effector of murein hydrolase LrgA (UPF0299 family)
VVPVVVVVTVLIELIVFLVVVVVVVDLRSAELLLRCLVLLFVPGSVEVVNCMFFL